jgi:predicted aconitase with swiveling domain
VTVSVQAEVVIPGELSATVLATSEPLSFWGGYDAATGEIVDRRHPLSGANASGKVFAVPFTKGSSTTTAVLLESIRTGHCPAAIVSRGTDSFLALASIVADEMYGSPIPLLAVSAEDFARFRTGQTVTIHRDGTIEIDTDTDH